MNDPKRILIVILVLSVIILGASGIKNFADSAGYKKQALYTTAIKIDSRSEFAYAIETRQGNMLANGTFDAGSSGLAAFPEMTQGFAYVERTREHYTAHTSCSKDSCYTYYSWDVVDTEERFAEKISLYGLPYLGTAFNYNDFLENKSCEGITDKVATGGLFFSKNGCGGGYYYIDSNDRYGYSVVPVNFTATFLTNTLGGKLEPVGESKISLQDRSIEQAVVDSGRYKTISFWLTIIAILLLTIIASVLTYKWVLTDGEWSIRR